MPPQSMTGYGRGFSENFKVEIRSSNHKNIDIHINIPYYLYSHEPVIRKAVRQKFNRGRIDIYVPRQEVAGIKLKVNKSLAREYYNALVLLRDELSISDNIGIDFVAAQRDVFLMDEPEINSAEFGSALDNALEELKTTRIEEGKNLVQDIVERIESVRNYIGKIEQKRNEFVGRAKETLFEKLKEYLGSVHIDESRLIQETAILIEKSDITEEIVRLKSHLKHFEDVLRSGDTIGKKLDFIVQELRREITTVSAKTQDYEIAHNVVEIKHELEKMREQIQNLQ